MHNITIYKKLSAIKAFVDILLALRIIIHLKFFGVGEFNLDKLSI